MENFKILPLGKDDKQEELGMDKIGYLSVHYIASLSDNHINLAENKKFTGLKFEKSLLSGIFELDRK